MMAGADRARIERATRRVRRALELCALPLDDLLLTYGGDDGAALDSADRIAIRGELQRRQVSAQAAAVGFTRRSRL